MLSVDVGQAGGPVQGLELGGLARGGKTGLDGVAQFALQLLGDRLMVRRLGEVVSFARVLVMIVQFTTARAAVPFGIAIPRGA